MLQWIGSILSIIFVDLALSGDNALVIGTAAAILPRRQRLYAILLGGGGAIILRIVFASVATLLLQLPLLQAIGGVIVFVIAFRLLLERSQKRRHRSSEGNARIRRIEDGFFAALLTIIVADVTMSLDNVLAIAALAQGQIPALSIGLFVSIALVLLGSALVAEIIRHIPLLLDLASLILAWTSGTLILHDIRLGPVLRDFPWTQIVIPGVASVVILFADLFLWRRDVHRMERQ